MTTGAVPRCEDSTWTTSARCFVILRDPAAASGRAARPYARIETALARGWMIADSRAASQGASTTQCHWHSSNSSVPTFAWRALSRHRRGAALPALPSHASEFFRRSGTCSKRSRSMTGSFTWDGSRCMQVAPMLSSAFEKETLRLQSQDSAGDRGTALPRDDLLGAAA